MNSYQTVTAAFTAAGLSKQRAVRFGRYWEGGARYNGPKKAKLWSTFDVWRNGALKGIAHRLDERLRERTSDAIVDQIRDQSEDRPAIKFLVQYQEGSPRPWQVIRAGDRQAFATFPKADSATRCAVAWEAGMSVAQYEREHGGVDKGQLL